MVGPLTKEEMKHMEKYFVGSTDDDFLFEACDFDKNTKKYSTKDKSDSCINMAYYPSRLKISNIFTKKQFDRNLLLKKNEVQLLQSELTSSFLLETVVPRAFLDRILGILKLHAAEIETENISKSLKEELVKLELLKASEEYQSVSQKVYELFPSQEEENDQVKKMQEECLAKERNKKKEERMKKFKSKQNKFLETHKEELENIKEEESSLGDICMICRSNEKREEDVLCYLASYR